MSAKHHTHLRAHTKIVRWRLDDPQRWMYRGWVTSEDGYSWHCGHRHADKTAAQDCADRKLNKMLFR